MAIEIDNNVSNTFPAMPFHPDFRGLCKLIDALPIEQKFPFSEELGNIYSKLEQQQKMLLYIQDVLSQLRLDLKYVMFDLDATRMERDAYLLQLRETNF